MLETPVDTGDSRPRVSVVDAWLGPMSTTVREQYEVGDLDPAGVLEAAAEAEQTERRAAFRKLQLAAHWADLHPAAADTGVETPGGAALLADESLGGDGTPLVAAFASEPFALALGLSPSAGTQLIADALDLRHRLPMLWKRVSLLEVPAWQARRVARQTHRLTKAAAVWVDEQVADRGSCGPVIVDRLVAQAIAMYDPEEHEDRENDAQADWDVTLTHPDPTDFLGTSHLEAPGDTLALKAFYDQVCAIAHQLLLDGDTDPLGARKIKAIGILTGQPQTPGNAKIKAYVRVDADRPRDRRRRRLHPGRRRDREARRRHPHQDPHLGRPPPSRHPTGAEHGPPRRRRLPRPTRMDARPRPPPRRPLHLPQMPGRRQVLRPRPIDPLRRERTTRPNPGRRTSPACAGDTTAPRPPVAGGTSARPTATTNGTARTAPRTSSRRVARRGSEERALRHERARRHC